MTTQTLEDRIKAIKYKDIKRIDLFTYEVTSSTNKEVKYMVFKAKALGWTCTCKDFMFRADPTNNDYQCKHILRVKKMIKESFLRQMRKAKKELSN